MGNFRQSVKGDNMNVFVISGRLTREPELKYSQSGKAFSRFGIAVTRPFNREETDFFDVTCFGRLAETVAEHLIKGQQAIVSGRVEINQREDKRYTNVIAENVEFGQKPRDSEEPPF